MVRLAGLSGDRDLVRLSSLLSLGLGHAAGASLHVLDPGARHRHPLEAQMLRSRGERYRDYQSRTSTFFLLPPQKGAI
jgi:hypothetical protein